MTEPIADMDWRNIQLPVVIMNRSLHRVVVFRY